MLQQKDTKVTLILATAHIWSGTFSGFVREICEKVRENDKRNIVGTLVVGLGDVQLEDVNRWILSGRHEPGHRVLTDAEIVAQVTGEEDEGFEDDEDVEDDKERKKKKP